MKPAFLTHTSATRLNVGDMLIPHPEKTMAGEDVSAVLIPEETFLRRQLKSSYVYTVSAETFKPIEARNARHEWISTMPVPILDVQKMTMNDVLENPNLCIFTDKTVEDTVRLAEQIQKMNFVASKCIELLKHAVCVTCRTPNTLKPQLLLMNNQRD